MDFTIENIRKKNQAVIIEVGIENSDDALEIKIRSHDYNGWLVRNDKLEFEDVETTPPSMTETVKKTILSNTDQYWRQVPDKAKKLDMWEYLYAYHRGTIQS